MQDFSARLDIIRMYGLGVCSLQPFEPLSLFTRILPSSTTSGTHGLLLLLTEMKPWPSFLIFTFPNIITYSLEGGKKG